MVERSREREEPRVMVAHVTKHSPDHIISVETESAKSLLLNCFWVLSQSSLLNQVSAQIC